MRKSKVIEEIIKSTKRKPISVFRDKPKKHFGPCAWTESSKCLSLDDAVQMIIDYLGVKYVGGTTKEPSLITAKKDKK